MSKGTLIFFVAMWLIHLPVHYEKMQWFVLPASPASCTHNFSLRLANFVYESVDSQNTVENCSQICYRLMILSWESMNFNPVNPWDSTEPNCK